MHARRDDALREILRRYCVLASFAACSGWEVFAGFIVEHAAET